jgi:hypothetical protein
VIRLERPDGEVREISIPVREWRAADALYTQGAIDIIGLLMALLGIGAFILRPWEPESWALLAICCLAGGALETLYVPQGPDVVVRPLYFSALIGFVYVAPFHVALRCPRCTALASNWAARSTRWARAPLLSLRRSTPGARSRGPPAARARHLLLAIASLMARSLAALRASERVVRQRARILLSGTLFGFAPLGVVLFLQIGLRSLSLDARLAYWLLGIFYFAMARITVRGELLNARVAVRRAVLYSAAVVGLTLIAAWLSALSPWAVALLLLPVLYLWPSYSARLDARLYPKRAQLPELVRATGRELAAQGSVDGVLRCWRRSASG